jgi:hypothetical protein
LTEQISTDFPGVDSRGIEKASLDPLRASEALGGSQQLMDSVEVGVRVVAGYLKQEVSVIPPWFQSIDCVGRNGVDFDRPRLQSARFGESLSAKSKRNRQV